MISLKNVLDTFWDWRMASVCVEVDWFACQSGAPATARVSLDGLVTHVDPAGIVTVSGDGREIELDLRPCSFRRPREIFGRGALESLDPDSILQIDFPTGEVCLLFPYRRVAASHHVAGQILHGLQWSKNDLSLLSTEARPSGEESPQPKPEPEEESTKARKRKQPPPPKIVKTNPPLFPVVSVMLCIALIVLVIIPLKVPEMLAQLSFHTEPMTSPSARVWVIPEEGSYYCSGSLMSGRQPGHYMEQAEALTKGYQPAMGHYCESGGAESGQPAGRLTSPLTTPFLSLRETGARFWADLEALPRSWFSHVSSRPYLSERISSSQRR
jgi:hypothetical protein